MSFYGVCHALSATVTDFNRVFIKNFIEFYIYICIYNFDIYISFLLLLKGDILASFFCRDKVFSSISITSVGLAETLIVTD